MSDERELIQELREEIGRLRDQLAEDRAAYQERLEYEMRRHDADRDSYAAKVLALDAAKQEIARLRAENARLYDATPGGLLNRLDRLADDAAMAATQEGSR